MDTVIAVCSVPTKENIIDHCDIMVLYRPRRGAIFSSVFDECVNILCFKDIL